MRIGFLPQEPQLDAAKTVREAVEEGLGPKCCEAKQKLDEIYAAYAEPDADFDKLAAEQAKYEAIIATVGRRHRSADGDRGRRARGCRRGTRRSRSLSGGEKRRVALCRLLLSKPDMLLLDEPTNHLDAESVEWLEQFLQRFPGTVIAVTHDRYFLDNAAEWILELDRGYGIPWKGNYSSWLEQKEARLKTRGEAGGGAHQGDAEGAGVGAPEREGAAGEGQGAHRALRGAVVVRASDSATRRRRSSSRSPSGSATGDRIQRA